MKPAPLKFDRGLRVYRRPLWPLWLRMILMCGGAIMAGAILAWLVMLARPL